MLSMLNLVYVLPVVFALIVAGLVVNGRLNGAARTLMWTGITVTCLTRIASTFAPWLLLNRDYPQFYAAVNLTNAMLGALGVVLLVVAIGAAARGPRPAVEYPSQRSAPPWPGQSPWPGQHNEPGRPGGFTPHGQPPEAGQPGSWTTPSHGGNQG